MPIENRIAMFLMVFSQRLISLGLKLKVHLFIIYLPVALLVIISLLAGEE